MASSPAAQHRWRKQAVESEVGPVPAAYWDLAKYHYYARQERLAKAYGAGKYRPKKLDGTWIVLRVEGDGARVENPDLANCYKTMLKMAKSAPTWTPSSRPPRPRTCVRTQDVEDVLPERVVKPTEAPKAEPADIGKRHAADTPAKQL